MPASIVGALIFSFVFFAVWSLKDALGAVLNISAPVKSFLICVLFVLFAYLTTRLA